MKFASLGSGSSGNATLVQCGRELLLIDCGFGVRDATRRLAELNVTPAQLTAIIVTHEHTDHMKGVLPLARKNQTPVYLTEGTWASRDHGHYDALNFIRDYQPFRIGDVDIIPVAVPHDAREPAQFVVEWQNKRLGVLTDVGHITQHILTHYQNCDALLVEANHDLDMLRSGPYPISLQKRVASDWGHLNNQQTFDFIRQIVSQRLKTLVVGHMSEKNNATPLVTALLDEIELGETQAILATQQAGFDWVNISE